MPRQKFLRRLSTAGKEMNHSTPADRSIAHFLPGCLHGAPGLQFSLGRIANTHRRFMRLRIFQVLGVASGYNGITLGIDKNKHLHKAIVRMHRAFFGKNVLVCLQPVTGYRVQIAVHFPVLGSRL